MKSTLLTVWGFALLAGVVANTAFAESPVLEVTDHGRGFKFITVSEDWAFSPISRHGIIIVKSGSSIRIDKAFGKQSDEEAVAKAKVSIEKNEKEKLLQENEKVAIGGNVTAPAITVERTGYRKTIVQLLWFRHRDVQYKVSIEFDPEKAPDFKADAHALLKAMELF